MEFIYSVASCQLNLQIYYQRKAKVSLLFHLRIQPCLSICNRVKVNTWKHFISAMKAANRVKLCLPDPPTPTSKAFPLGCIKTSVLLGQFFKSRNAISCSQ